MRTIALRMKFYLIILFANLQYVFAVDALYVTMHDSTIVKYDVSSGDPSLIESSKSIFATGINIGTTMAFDNLGNLYVGEGLDNRIVKIIPDGSVSNFVNSNLHFPWGLAFDSSGNLFAANNFGGVISKILPDGTVTNFITESRQFYGIAFDASDNLYVAKGNEVDRISPDGTITSVISSGLVQAWSLAFDSTGNLYVANAQGYYPENNGTGTIIKRTPQGDTSVFVTNGLDFPASIAVDSAGYIYVANWNNNTISRVNPSGIFDFSWSTGSVMPRFLAFPHVQVPEPHTFILTIIASIILLIHRYQKHLPSLQRDTVLISFNGE